MKNKLITLLFLSAVFSFLVLAVLSKNYLYKTPESVIVITIDALRPDHLGCYGYERVTSYNIDNVAKEGVCFLNCFATSCSTVHATPAFLSGKYLGIFNFDVLLQQYDNIVDEKFVTLAEYLKSSGYFTAAFLNNGHYRIGTGFEQGFDRYKNYIGNAKDTTDEVISFLNNYSENKPFFIWVHYIDPHVPYSAPEKYFKVFEGDKLYKEDDKILKLHPDDNAHLNMSEGYIPRAAFHKDKYFLNYYVARYDAEILYTDFHIGRLLEHIKDNTLIIISADHGESLGEHNLYFHHESTHEEILHVPLIIKDKRYFKGGRKITKAVSSVDIVPTIFNRLHPIWYFFHKNRFDGIDLKKVVKAKAIKRKYIYSYFPQAWIIREVNRSVKYILHDDGKEELYVLPDEDTDRINDDSLEISSIRKELSEQLKTWLKDYPIRSDINSCKSMLVEEEEKNLRSLGYLQ